MRVPTAGLQLCHVATMRSIARGLKPYTDILTGYFATAADCRRVCEPVLLKLGDQLGGWRVVEPGVMSASFTVYHVRAVLVVWARAHTFTVSLTMEKTDAVSTHFEEPTGWGFV